MAADDDVFRAVAKNNPGLDAMLNQLAGDDAAAASDGVVEADFERDGAIDYVLLVGVQKDEVDFLTEMIRSIEHLQDVRIGYCPQDCLETTVGACVDGHGVKMMNKGTPKYQELLGARMILLGGEEDEELTGAIMALLDESDIRPLMTIFVDNAPDEKKVGDVCVAAIREYDEVWGLRDPMEVLPDSEWDPKTCTCTLNLELDGAMVYTRGLTQKEEGVRWDTGRIVVIDDFFGEDERKGIMNLLAPEDWDHKKGPPTDKWERVLSDKPGLTQSMGLSGHALEELCESKDRALLEIQTRLSRLYPEYIISRMPAALFGGEVAPIVANAPMSGESFSWHKDADPATVPPSPWRDRFGSYYNREPCKPLMATALLYLDEAWPNEWDAETLFLDDRTGTGVFVRPRAGRLVMMDQDVTHRVSAPSPLADRPRYSFVFKLCMHAKDSTASPTIARPEWGDAVRLGSATEKYRKEAEEHHASPSHAAGI